MKTPLLAIGFFFILGTITAQSAYKLYAGQGYTNNILVLDPISLDTTKFIADAGGYRMVHCPIHNKIYSTGGDDAIYVVDLISDELVNTIDPSDGKIGSSELEPIAISPDQSTVYVADESSDALFVLNTADDVIVGAVYLDDVDEMENMVISNDGLFLFVADNTDVLKISTETLTVVDRIAVNGDSHGIAISSDGLTIYAETDGVAVIDVVSFSIVDTYDSQGYFLSLNADDTRVIGVGESSEADITEIASGITTNVDWESGSARGSISHPDNSAYFIATTSGVHMIDAESLTVVNSSESIYFQSILIISDDTTPTHNLSNEKRTIKAFPNPFQTELNLQFDMNAQRPISIDIVDLNGRTLRTFSIQQYSAEANTITIDLTNLNDGIYICSVNYSDYSEIIKILK